MAALPSIPPISNNSAPSTSAPYQTCPEEIKPQILECVHSTLALIEVLIPPIPNQTPLQLRNFYVDDAEMNDFYNRVYTEILNVAAEEKEDCYCTTTQLHFDPNSPDRFAMPSKTEGAEYRKGTSRTAFKPLDKIQYNKDLRTRIHEGSGDTPNVRHDGDRSLAEANLYDDPNYAHLIPELHDSIQSRYDQKYESARQLFEELTVIAYIQKEITDVENNSLTARIKLSLGPWKNAVNTPILGSRRSGWNLNAHHSNARITSIAAPTLTPSLAVAGAPISSSN